MFPIDLVMHIPITHDCDRAIFSHEIMAGQKLMDVPKQGLFSRSCIEMSGIRRAPSGSVSISGMNGSSAFDLRCEVQNAVNNCVIKGFDPETIPRREQPPFASSHSAKANMPRRCDRNSAPMFVRGEDAFGVGLGAELPAT